MPTWDETIATSLYLNYLINGRSNLQTNKFCLPKGKLKMVTLLVFWSFDLYF